MTNSQSRALRWTRVVAVLAIASVTYGAPTISVAQKGGTGATRQLDGWQKAKFGMTLEQVQAAYPEGQVDVELVKSCRNIARELLAVDRYKRIFEDGYADLSESSSFDCRKWELQEYNLGRDKFDVEFFFSRSDQRLEKVELLSIKMDSQAYSYYKQILEAKYGQGREANNQEQVQATCASIEARLKRNDQSLRGGEILWRISMSFRRNSS
ncbi:MAG: hypothetical protein WBK08_18110 [Nitrospira sp.]|nr:MAG: hypothetical protein E8D42_13205 [Nitrospira sp.]